MKMHAGGHRCLAAILVISFLQVSPAVSHATESSTPVIASQFASEVSKDTYEATDEPQITPIFRWDFSKEAVYTYAYEQEVRNNTDIGSMFGGQRPDARQELSAKGNLLIRSKGDGTADLVLKDMLMSMKMYMGEPEPKTMEQQAPPLVVQGLREDGSGSFGNSSQDFLLRMLFPLPPKYLRVGEFVDIPAQIPFNAMGSLLQVTGHSRITLTRYVKVGKLTCAQFDVQTDVSELKVPAELEGDYKFSTKGTSVFFFDLATRAFESGKIALITQMNIDAPMPQMKMSGMNAPEMPKRSKTSMTNDNLISVKHKE